MSKLLVLFPGIGYTVERPLLKNASELALKLGYDDKLNIEYLPINKEGIRGNDAAMDEAIVELYSQAKEQLKDIDWSLYEDVLFISKSIGTAVAAIYAAEHGLTQVKHVLYTPLKQTFGVKIDHGIVFIGTSDRWSDYNEIINLSAKAGVDVFVYEGCNHSLETEDASVNAGNLCDVMRKTEAYLSGNGGISQLKR